ncbi:MAG: hypothetical protein JNK18_12135 [Cyclobacteriaceae bacterium]|nr:hypothetical protein [Cyclobacteriaceae bacterium]
MKGALNRMFISAFEDIITQQCLKLPCRSRAIRISAQFEPQVFFITLAGSALLALGSMLYVVWKVTQANPAVVLKNELALRAF